jgi:hypothetical protein
MNGEENYIDDVHAPFPAIRFIYHNICLFWCLDVGQRVEREDRVTNCTSDPKFEGKRFLPLSFLSIVLTFFYIEIDDEIFPTHYTEGG